MLDREERLILCSSFSKFLSRDSRLDWVVGSRWHDDITLLKLDSQLSSIQAIQQGIANFISDGHFRRHLFHNCLRLSFTHSVEGQRLTAIKKLEGFLSY